MATRSTAYAGCSVAQFKAKQQAAMRFLLNGHRKKISTRRREGFIQNARELARAWCRGER